MAKTNIKKKSMVEVTIKLESSGDIIILTKFGNKHEIIGLMEVAKSQLLASLESEPIYKRSK